MPSARFILLTPFFVHVPDALQQYVILAAQAPGGGLRDKPGKPADAYHTSYNLSGHSAAQHDPRSCATKRQKLAREFVSPFRARAVVFDSDSEQQPELILGPGESERAAEARMQEIWSRELSWTTNDDSKIVYGDEDSNSLVRSRPLVSTDSE